MSHFFTGSGDTYENAEDKDMWMAETMSGQYDYHWISTLPPQAANAGSMCPVEHGGLTVDHLDHQITTVYYGTA
jgi:hypothetical protein